jgi:hypothetical protein
LGWVAFQSRAEEVLLEVVKMLRLIMVFGGIILLGWQGVSWMRAREPIYEGKRLGEWLEIYQEQSWDSPEWHKAVDAVQSIGPDAIPSLLRTMSYERSPIKEEGLSLLQRQKLVRIEPVPVGMYRARGADGFEILGEMAQPAAPKLEKLLKSRNDHIKYLAFISLLEVQPDREALVPVLVKASKSPDPCLSREAVNALRYFDPEAARRAGLGGPVAQESYVYIKYEMLREGDRPGFGVRDRS